MATKTKKEETTLIDSTAKKVLNVATKANDLALQTTDTVVTKSINLTEKGFGFSNGVVNRGLEISAKNQDFVFNTLEMVKGKALSFFSKSK